MTDAFQPDEDFARQLDAEDPLRGFRDRFLHPRRPDGSPLAYLAGHSLGLQPQSARGAILAELDDWAALAVDGHFEGRRPWYSYHELFRKPLARLVGAQPDEVVAMNSLTVNLHLLMVSFYRPTPTCHRILIDYPPFPSDLYAVQSQMTWHGYDPEQDLLYWRPRPGEHTLRVEDLAQLLDRQGNEIALVLISGVNFYTGQLFDVARIVSLARRHGCIVGFDLAHAAGNVPLRLHDWGVDFAAWCSYKYLNGGPGAVAGCFVHERHGRTADLPRLGGWWGNDPGTRFRMHLEADFVPRTGADGWQVSNPPILAMAPVLAALEHFEAAGMAALRVKSLGLSGYLRWLLERQDGHRFEIITPADAAEHGSQVSLLVHEYGRELFNQLGNAGIVCDFRDPDVIRAAPVPLYNSFHDVWRFAAELRAAS